MAITKVRAIVKDRIRQTPQSDSTLCRTFTRYKIFRHRIRSSGLNNGAIDNQSEQTKSPRQLYFTFPGCHGTRKKDLHFLVSLKVLEKEIKK
jgi:hypothetical protein